VVESADRDGVFVADLSVESTGLSEANVIGFGWRAAAHDARLAGRDELTVLLVPQANGFRCNATTARSRPTVGLPTQPLDLPLTRRIALLQNREADPSAVPSLLAQPPQFRGCAGVISRT